MNSLIVTTQYVNNYGAVLQAYGFHCFLKENGWEHVFLNQYSISDEIFKPLFTSQDKILYNMLTNIKSIKLYRKLKRKRKNFDRFRDLFIPQTNFIYHEKDNLNGLNNFDLLITGGDQMFNRSCLNRPVNLLLFGSDTAKRISYSTSLGSSKFSDQEYKWLCEQLGRYDALSIRESDAAEALSIALNKEVYCNIDGAFLGNKEDYVKAMSPVKGIPDAFVLIYELLPHQQVQSVAKAVSGYYGISTVSINNTLHNSGKADYDIMDAGPGEFLWLFQKAKAVVTTSFHGTCFSIINHKPFFTLIRQTEKRIPSLLDRMNLTCCYGEEFTQFPYEVDFHEADTFIDLQRVKAQEYLRNFYEQ